MHAIQIPKIPPSRAQGVEGRLPCADVQLKLSIIPLPAARFDRQTHMSYRFRAASRG